MVIPSTIFVNYGRIAHTDPPAVGEREEENTVKPTIVFDFDGTLALGDGPITAFATAIADSTRDTTFVERAAAALDAFASGQSDARDGYDAVTRLATSDGIPAATIGDAYDISRTLLGTADAMIAPPTDIADFLTRIGRHARLVLATNAPGAGVTEVLTAWGIVQSFDDFHFSVGKPAGLIPVLRAALAQGPVLAVGDIVALDLAPARDLGADTALVGATATWSTASVTMRGASLADLYEPIIAWVQSAASPTPSPSENLPSTERQN